jgi:hypothetical protein
MEVFAVFCVFKKPFCMARARAVITTWGTGDTQKQHGTTGAKKIYKYPSTRAPPHQESLFAANPHRPIFNPYTQRSYYTNRRYLKHKRNRKSQKRPTAWHIYALMYAQQQEKNNKQPTSVVVLVGAGGAVVVLFVFSLSCSPYCASLWG